MNEHCGNPGADAPTVGQRIEGAKQRHAAGDLDAAELLYREVLQADADQPDALHFLGVIAHQRGDNERAADLIGRSIALKSDCFKSHNNLGLALKALGKPQKAMASFRAAIALAPDDARSRYNLGVALAEQERWADAAASLREAIAFERRFAEAHFYLALALRRQDRPDEAVESYRNAIAAKPDFAEAHVNLGTLLKRRGHLDEAIGSFRRALAIKPDFADARSKLLLALNYSADATQAEIERESLAWGDAVSRAKPAPAGFANEPSPDRRIKVGYVSPDMREHSVAYFLEPLLVAHDPGAVETFCYAGVAKPDATTRRIEAHADHWRDTTGLDDDSLAALIRRDGIDILVDLAGHTQDSRLAAFAGRPAPVQVSWLGYPNTTGLRAMDYRFVDAITDPADEGVETPVRLANGFLCYRPSDEAPAPSPSPGGAGAVTFGSFNNAVKMSKGCIELWSRVLLETPGSSLLLKSGTFADPSARETVARGFSGCGIEADRLRMRPARMSVREHLAHYGEVDVCLDPLPYNGTTTTCEALWMGVPVVTLRGDHHRSRVGASILSRIGMGDCVAATADGYVSAAAGLARDRSRRDELRRTLRGKMAPLCDAETFARDMEAAMRTIWTRWCRLSG